MLDLRDLDTKTQLQAMALLSDLYRSILTMATDGGIVEQAMKKALETKSVQKPTEEEEQAIIDEHFSGLEETEAEAKAEEPTEQEE
jgi:hypothetical protein